MQNLAQNTYEMTPEKLAVRDIAEHYLKLQENTQFLTHVFRHQPLIRRPIFTINIPHVNVKSFFHLIIQTSYLLFTCCITKTSVLLSKQLFVEIGKQSGQEVIREYILEEEFVNMSEKRKAEVSQNFQLVNTYKYEASYAQYICKWIQIYLKSIRQYIEKYKDKKLVSDKSFMRVYENIFNVLKLFIPQISTMKPKVIISCLEETELFRTHSYLLQVLNCSIFEAVRRGGKVKEVLKEIKNMENILSKRYHLMYRQNGIEKDEKILQNSIEEFIIFLLQENIIEIEISYNSNSKNQSKIGASEQTKDDRIIYWRIKVSSKKIRQLNQKLIESIQFGDIEGYNQQKEIINEKQTTSFIIEYHTKKNMVVIKCVGKFEVSIQNSDAIMYHCNNMAIQWNYMRVEQIEREKAGKRKEKNIAFRIMSFFNVKDSPFINILINMDLAMIYCKVLQPELMRDSIKLDDYNKFTQAGHKINHLTQIFNRKIRKFYENTGMKTY